jgi:competence protein ComEC
MSQGVALPRGWLGRRMGAAAVLWLVVGAAWRDWAADERGRFVLWLPVAMTAGNAAYFSLLDEPAPWRAVAVLAPAVVLAVVSRRWLLPHAACLVVVALSLGFAAAQFATTRAPPPMDVPRRAVVVAGTVRAVETLPSTQRVTLEWPDLGDGVAQPRRVRVRLRAEDPAAPVTGDTMRVRALLSRPNAPAYPGGWDLQRDAYFSGIGAYGYALGQAEILRHAAPAGVARTLQSLRETIAGRIAAVLPDSAGAICTTLLTGSAVAIPESDRAAFRNAGLAHLLAIAGLHIGIVMGLVFGLVRVLLAAWERAALHWPTKSMAALAALSVGGGYMLLTGAHVPIIRSFAMACLVTLGVVVGRRALSLRGLALAMAALLLIAPEQAMGVSFQMSFSAVLALIAGYDALRPALRRLHGHGGWQRRLLSHVAALALTSALAGTASAPFAAYHFGEVQLYNVIANVAAVPLTAMWIMPAGLIALLLMPLHLEALALVPMGWGASAVLWIGHAVSALPSATVAVPHMPPWGLAMAALGMAWLGLWRTRVRLAGVPVLLFGLASPAMVRPPDMLLAADAGLVAFHANRTIYVHTRPSFSGFTQDAWVQMWGGGPPRALPEHPEGGLSCTELACRFQVRPDGPIAMLVLTGRPADACDADLLVSQEPIRWHCSDTDPWRIDRFTVWRDGAQAIWLGAEGVRVLSDREARGRRPWVPPPPD